ncbi:MAG: GWxTD domain-containing protein [Candidatus Aminicenantes bacterium]|nr:MAG: GWxTD domain-containing protein [Candidatus Aminicenantes bacterium]
MRKLNCSLLLFFCFLIFISCTSRKLEKNLSPENKEFFSKVRYIITKQERKIFLNLPPSDRKYFIEEFWKKRDPDPYTEENEFKAQYFARIEESNRLFVEGATPGWLQDRGRVYILLGPPERRDVYPRGYSFYGKPMEIWFYGFFPIPFIDHSQSGNYKLEPLSARHIAEINRAQMELKPKTGTKNVVFDLNLIIERVKENEALIHIGVPYKNIWFAEKENKLETTLKLSVEIFSSSEKKVWVYQKNYLLSLLEENLEEVMGKEYIIEIPVSLEQGNFTLTAELENKTDESRVRKKIEFTI